MPPIDSAGGILTTMQCISQPQMYISPQGCVYEEY